jgi:hypothetical protein
MVRAQDGNPENEGREETKGRSTSFKRAFIVAPIGGAFASIDVKVISTAVLIEAEMLAV